jgi:hypothetical protein
VPPPAAELHEQEVRFAKLLEAREHDLIRDPQNLQYPFQAGCNESHLA